MGKQKLKGKDLRKIGFKSDKAKSIAINIMAEHYKHTTKVEKLALLKKVLNNPEKYRDHEYLQPLAELYLAVVIKEEYTAYQLKEKPVPFRVFGRPFISYDTIMQMDTAMSLPIAKQGAIMPDAHVGYGLPIGGVLATRNEVIPYAVGLDIGCRMALTVFEAPESFIAANRHKLKLALKEETHFGIVKTQDEYPKHAILDRSEFNQSKLLKQLRGKAISQLGTSGGGNHFVEFGVVELAEGNALGLPAGNYTGLLSHSGSRGLGATIANYYKKVASDLCRLPRGSEHLAWLDLNSAEGQEYWLAMNLAGDYATACHEVIHQKLSKSIGLKPLAAVSNHHNFAWKEKDKNGNTIIVHRKGATPAAKGELGIIPGSMTTAGYIVSGKGNSDSLNSAAHGAGRKFSRSKAKMSFTKSDMRQVVKNAGVTLIGGGLDEAPFAYKDIESVMQGQTDLVNIEGRFLPKIVRMTKS